MSEDKQGYGCYIPTTFLYKATHGNSKNCLQLLPSRERRTQQLSSFINLWFTSPGMQPLVQGDQTSHQKICNKNTVIIKPLKLNCSIFLARSLWPQQQFTKTGILMQREMKSDKHCSKHSELDVNSRNKG